MEIKSAYIHVDVKEGCAPVIDIVVDSNNQAVALLGVLVTKIGEVFKNDQDSLRIYEEYIQSILIKVMK